MKCCSCSSNEELPEGTLMCSECSSRLIGEGKNYMRGFSYIGRGSAVTSDKIRDFIEKVGAKNDHRKQ